MKPRIKITTKHSLFIWSSTGIVGGEILPIKMYVHKQYSPKEQELKDFFGKAALFFKNREIAFKIGDFITYRPSDEIMKKMRQNRAKIEETYLDHKPTKKTPMIQRMMYYWGHGVWG